MYGQATMQETDTKTKSGDIAPRITPPLSLAQEKSKAETASASCQEVAQESKMEVESLNFFYGRTRALKNISLTVPANQVTAFIGPSVCGKSTLIRTLNRMNDVIPGARVEGRVELDGENIYAPGTDVVLLRRKVGIVFQKPNPFPRSIFDNVAYGLKI